MDFHSLLSTAQQNISSSKNKDKYYSTSYAPPKKETKEKKLSNNIKKFLEKQKLEDEEKQRAARDKKLEMLAKRDPKIQRKVEKSLKVFKSSKKFYTGDKTLDENTAVTLQNEQPDEDDYGFASSTSDIYHKQLMEKYQKLPPDNKFSKSSNQKKGKSSVTQNGDDIHIKNGHRDRKSNVKGESSSNQKSSSSSTKSSHTEKKLAEEKPKPKLKAAPIVDFHELLKLAEKKQHEEILVDVPTKKEPERLLTSKEKRELEELEAQKRAKMKPPQSIPKIPKLGAIPKVGEALKHDRNNNSKEEIKKTNGLDKRNGNSSLADRQKLKSTTSSPHPSSSKLRDALIKSEKLSKAPINSKVGASLKPKGIQPKPSTSTNVKSSLPQKSDRPSTSKEISKTREFPPRDLQKTREFPPRDMQKSRDLKRPMLDKKASRHPMPNKRRMYDEDEDSEYDSEMDDFIDDGDEDIDVSSAIKSIFGYDKSRYRNEDYDDRDMESNFQTVMKEEIYSKKIGLMEDLEDMRREAEEIKQKEMKRKMLAKKKKYS